MTQAKNVLLQYNWGHWSAWWLSLALMHWRNSLAEILVTFGNDFSLILWFNPLILVFAAAVECMGRWKKWLAAIYYKCGCIRCFLNSDFTCTRTFSHDQPCHGQVEDEHFGDRKVSETLGLSLVMTQMIEKILVHSFTVKVWNHILQVFKFIFVLIFVLSVSVLNVCICPGNDTSYQLITFSGLADLVAMCLPLGPRFVGSILAKVDGFLREMEIHSTTSFRKEVMSGVPCCTFTACKRTFHSW